MGYIRGYISRYQRRAELRCFMTLHDHIPKADPLRSRALVRQHARHAAAPVFKILDDLVAWNAIHIHHWLLQQLAAQKCMGHPDGRADQARIRWRAGQLKCEHAARLEHPQKFFEVVADVPLRNVLKSDEGIYEIVGLRWKA